MRFYALVERLSFEHGAGLEHSRRTSLSLVPRLAPGLLVRALFCARGPCYGAGMAEYSDDLLRDILQRTQVIAAVGVSANPIRPSYFVARYLSRNGYRVIPVNPALAGQQLFGEAGYAEISDIPRSVPVDMVDIFRRPEAVPGIVDAAIAALPSLWTVWMQIGVRHAGAAARARAAGLDVIEDRCPKIERQRLYGELRKAGFNTGIISSRL